jgi:hypothetical protein
MPKHMTIIMEMVRGISWHPLGKENLHARGDNLKRGKELCFAIVVTAITTGRMSEAVIARAAMAHAPLTRMKANAEKRRW